MICQPRTCTAIVIIISAFIIVFFQTSAFATGRNFNAGEQAEIDSLPAALDQAFGDTSSAGRETDDSLLETATHYVAFADMQKPRFVNTAAVHISLADDMDAQPAAAGPGLNARQFSMIAPVRREVDGGGTEMLLEAPHVVDIVEEVPSAPVLQDNNFLGGTKDVSIIAVQVLTLFTDATNASGDLDLYVGLNSLNDADYRQSYGLLQAGQAVIGGISWTF